MTQYYVQNRARGYLGNCMLWWRFDDRGCTPNINEAKVFESHQIRGIDGIQEGSKIAWPKRYIDSKISQHVDFRACDHEMAMSMFGGLDKFTESPTPATPPQRIVPLASKGPLHVTGKGLETLKEPLPLMTNCPTCPKCDRGETVGVNQEGPDASGAYRYVWYCFACKYTIGVKP